MATRDAAQELVPRGQMTGLVLLKQQPAHCDALTCPCTFTRRQQHRPAVWTAPDHPETLLTQPLRPTTPEDYYRALVRSPAVLGKRDVAKDGKTVYSSKELKKIDNRLDVARLHLARMKKLWDVSDGLGGYSLDYGKLVGAYREALHKLEAPIVQAVRPGEVGLAAHLFEQEINHELSKTVEKELAAKRNNTRAGASSVPSTDPLYWGGGGWDKGTAGEGQESRHGGNEGPTTETTLDAAADEAVAKASAALHKSKRTRTGSDDNGRGRRIGGNKGKAVAEGAVLTRLRAAEVKRARLLHVLRDEELAMARLKEVPRMEGSQEMQSNGEAARSYESTGESVSVVGERPGLNGGSRGQGKTVLGDRGLAGDNAVEFGKRALRKRLVKVHVSASVHAAAPARLRRHA